MQTKLKRREQVCGESAATVNAVSRRPLRAQGVIDIGPALECSWVTTLSGRPYPIQFRNQGAIDAWTRALGKTEVWQRWQDPGTLCWQIRQEVLRQLERVESLPPVSEGMPQVVADEQRRLAVEISTNLKYHLNQGMVIGAIVGTAILPGVGTLVGGLVGGMVASMMGGRLHVELMQSVANMDASNALRAQTQAICLKIKAQHDLYQREMHAAFDVFYSEKSQALKQGFDLVAAASADGRSIQDGLSRIAAAMNTQLAFASRESFSRHLRSGDALAF